MSEVAVVLLPEEGRTLWASADCVCFDVDSTVVTEEAINVNILYNPTNGCRSWLSFVVVVKKLQLTQPEQ
jgi:hypothetical protein